MSEKTKIAVIGAGAIGGIAAGFIAKAGYDVELVCKHQSIVDKANSGLEIVGVRGKHKVKIKAVKEIDELSGEMDYILVATKTYDMPAACKQALKFSNKNTLFLSMQNGISIDAMADVVGEDRTVGCVVGFGATLLEPGILDMTSSGELLIGMKKKNKKLEELKEILDYVVETRITEEIFAELYSKLIVNSCISALGAVSGLYLGEMLKIKKARDLFIKIMEEAMAVAEAMHITVPPYGGKLDYYKLVKTDRLSRIKTHLMIYLVGLKYRKLKSSSLQSIERGRQTEIDYFNGYIAKKAKELNITTPVNDAVIDMIKKIEQGKLKIQRRNFDELMVLCK